MKKEKGRRLSIWVPEREYWLFDVIANIQREVEREPGVQMSKGFIVLNLLLNSLKRLKPNAERKDSSCISEEGRMAVSGSDEAGNNEAGDGIPD
jgi:hypothetical protein